MNYRADIQILRGISVLLVVLFHLGFEQFSSGFLGVDVFFVISGFLMAVLYNANETSKFFQRRALRLLPAYYVTLVATIILTFFLTTRHETLQVLEQTWYASFFASNLGFWNHTAYFASGDFNPLLHLWSLGVEIQFYLLVPLIAWFIRKQKTFLFLFLMGSLGLCFVTLTVSPKTAFFITPFRIWQFLIGFAAAVFFTNSGSTKGHEGLRWLGMFGLVLIVIIPIFPVDGKSLTLYTGHPGLIALVISIATATVLACGIPTFIDKSQVGGAFEKLGKYSYSIYLTHFPLIVIYNSEPFAGTVYGTDTTLDLIILVLLIAVSSYLLYHLVETKGGTKAIKENWGKLIVVSSVVVISLTSAMSSVQNQLLNTKERYIFAAEEDRPYYRCGKIWRAMNPFGNICELTGIASEKRILLAGNSHSDSIKGVFSEVAMSTGYQLYLYQPGNTMNVDGPSPKQIVAAANSLNVRHIFVHQSAMAWDYDLLNLLISEAAQFDIAVVYIEPVPIWEEQIPTFLYNKNINPEAHKMTKTIDEYYLENKEIFNGLERIQAENFSRISVAKQFCNPDCMYQSEDGKLYYFDQHHLTNTGSELMKPVLDNYMRTKVLPI